MRLEQEACQVPVTLRLRYSANASSSFILKNTEKVELDESKPFCGVSAQITTLIQEHAFDYLDAPIERICGADIPMPYAAELEAKTVPQVENIKNAVRRQLVRNV